MKTITTIEGLMSELESGNYNYYGLRGASEHDIEIGGRGYLDCSFNLVVDCNTRDCEYKKGVERLSGSSAIQVDSYIDEVENIKSYNEAKGYANNHHHTDIVYLLGDSDSEYGEDENEIILGHNGYGADVVAIVKL